MSDSRPVYFSDLSIKADSQLIHADMCVYAATSAGIVAAITARRRGLTVALLHPGDHPGGMAANGLSCTDVGNEAIIGGLTAEIFDALGRHYGLARTWRPEPHIVRRTFEQLMADHEITPIIGQYLHRVHRDGKRIKAIEMIGGLTVTASTFLDCSYEGDLMAAADVPFTLGREGNALYGETSNGVIVHDSHQFDHDVSPFRIEYDPASGLLPDIEPSHLGPIGAGDGRIQAYNFRVCMTADKANRIPFPKPENYNPRRYELCRRWLHGTSIDFFRKFDPIMGSEKTDTNNHGAFSTDLIGGSTRWPVAGYVERQRIFQEHVDYQQGLHHFLAHDPSVPTTIRDEYARWGLAADEFADTGHWPPQLYIREARRMLGDVVITEHHCRSDEIEEDVIAMGAYQMDSHNCRRFVDTSGFVRNEGDVQIRLRRPYGISYRAITPPTGSVTNLLVPVALSASHIAFGSIRMEPVFMMLAESAAIAGHLAASQSIPVQALPYPDLECALKEAGQVLRCDVAMSLNDDGNPETIVESS
ncbi:MAG: FAD-dependent oxidoreductase [Phycisphaeraceae bacterium]